MSTEVDAVIKTHKIAFYISQSHHSVQQLGTKIKYLLILFDDTVCIVHTYIPN